MGRIGRRTWLWVILSVCLLFSYGGCSTTTNPPHQSRASGVPVVRVLLLSAQPEVTLSASEMPMVSVGSEPPRRLGLPPNVAIPVTFTAKGAWQVGTTVINADGRPLNIRPVTEGSVSINGEPYRGTFSLVPAANGGINIINHVDVDAYLKSVLTKELPRDWHPEAYRAQAIAARTYALYEARTSAHAAYDLFPDVRSQVYGGIRSETDKSRQAVDDTAGVVVAYGQPGRERIFKSYFSACCGGISQSSYDAFGDPYSEPLSDQNVGRTCNISPRFNWGPIAVPKAELTKRFRAWGAARNRPEKGMGNVTLVRASGFNRHRRPVRFEVVDDKGNRFSWRGEELRWAVNTGATPQTTLSSSFVSILDSGGTVQFVDGHGYGHGVGLCQWCTQARALAGWAHEDIVVRSYPLSKLVRAY